MISNIYNRLVTALNRKFNKREALIGFSIILLKIYTTRLLRSMASDHVNPIQISHISLLREWNSEKINQLRPRDEYIAGLAFFCCLVLQERYKKILRD